jgi:hypothetical protein
MMTMMRQAPSSSSPSSPSSAPTAVASSLRALEERSNRLTRDIRQKEDELRMQQQLAASRMTQEATHQADVYEAKASEIKLQLSQYSSLTSSSSSPDSSLEASRLQKDLQAVQSSLSALYRSSMSQEAVQRDRRLRSELQDRESELRSVLFEVRRVKRERERSWLEATLTDQP